MATLIGSDIHTGNVGEDLLCAALLKAYPDEKYIIYRNSEVFGREFDVAMLIPGIGIVIFEAKGWLESTVKHVESQRKMVMLSRIRVHK